MCDCVHDYCTKEYPKPKTETRKIDWDKPLRIKTTMWPVRYLGLRKCPTATVGQPQTRIIAVDVGSYEAVLCVDEEGKSPVYVIENIPEPKKEIWINNYNGIYGIPFLAQTLAESVCCHPSARTIHFKEV